MTTSSIEGKDKFCQLPEDLIESIFERLPIRDAVRTSILSRNWRYNWVSMKTINFDKDFYRSLKNKSHYDKAVHDIMVQHEGTIESFSFYPPQYTTMSRLLSKALLIASTKVVNNLSLGMYGLVTPLYSFSQITHLKLENIQFTKPHPPTLCFAKLIRLDCVCVNFFHDSLYIFVSSCPILETLTMDSCGGPPQFNICCASLKHVEVYGETEPTFEINAGNLETLSATLPRTISCPLRIVEPLNYLKKLSLDCSSLEMKNGVAFLFSIIFQGLPNLAELKIKTYVLNGTKTLSGKENKMMHILPHLQFVTFTSILGLMSAQFLILKFLLALAPSLKKIVIRVLEHSDRDMLDIDNELMGYQRASPNVQIELNAI